MFLLHDKKRGEKGHFEYSKSSSLREKILQFHFQCVRNSDPANIFALQYIFQEILILLKTYILYNFYEKDELTIVTYKMIAYTRDILLGKGECQLAYMMLKNWTDYMNMGSECLLYSFVSSASSLHPYGSWKDIKYFFHYCTTNGWNENHPLIQYSIVLVNEQLKRDISFLENNQREKISLVAKWIPREKSRKFGAFFDLLATNYFSTEIPSNVVNNHKTRYKQKQNEKKMYRKILHILNVCLDTLQIKQCSQQWQSISFEKLTSISHQRQKNALLNITKGGNMRYVEKEDRILCSEKYQQFVFDMLTNNQDVKGTHILATDFTKQAIFLVTYGRSFASFDFQCRLLNSQWRHFIQDIPRLTMIVPILDLSYSMEGDALYTAINIACIVAEKSSLGKRIMTFGGSPCWINLDNSMEFIDMVEKILEVRRVNGSIHSNYYDAQKKIMEVIEEIHCSEKKEKTKTFDIEFLFLSDMQIDQPDNEHFHLYKEIYNAFSNYASPVFHFWNVRTTDGFPCHIFEKGCSMMSGFNPRSLQTFRYHDENADKDNNKIHGSMSPWSVFFHQINHKRYDDAENYIKSFLCV